ncbi:D-alanyl-D-alanine carboxypeptidase [Streptomyces sp. NPDC004014]
MDAGTGDASEAKAGSGAKAVTAATTAKGTGAASASADTDTGADDDASKATADSAPETATAAKGTGAASADSDTDSDSDTDAKSGADARDAGEAAKAGAGAKGAEGAGTAPANADGDTGTGSKAAGAKTAEAAAGEDAGSSADAGRDAGRKAGDGADPKAGAGAKGAEGAGTAPANADGDTDTGSKAAGEDAGSSADAGRKAGDAKDAKAGADADAKTGTNAKAGTDADAKASPNAKAGDAKDAKAGADADAKAGADADAKAGADAKAAKVAGAKAAAAAARAAKAAAAPQDASQGSRTADGASGAKASPAGAKGVDQPTTAFKSVRPKKPEVDQPTTMLKLGTAKPKPEGAAKAPAGPAAPDAERASKFVPLRNPDLNAPTSAIPQVGPERTTQQPLPPKPPLDLLAELTNTPPPPETPVRTLVRRVKIWTPLVILLAIVFAVVQAMRPLPQPTLDLTAEDTYTFGGRTAIPWPAQGQAALDVQGIGTFGSSGAQKPVPIASVAKVMTAYLILRDHPLKSGADGPKITIDQAAQDQSKAGQESTVDVTAGDSISQREALESILIASANNVARLLARWDVGSEKAFVTKMNATAKSLGMTNTTYTDPSGLTNSTVSTAVDQVKLAKAAMQEPAFREVAAMMSYDDYKGVNHSNWNHLVGHNNVVGIKTGTTTSALGNLVFAAKQEVGGETRTIVGAVVRQPAGGSDNTILSGALDAADKLIRSAQGALKPATVLKKGDVVGYVDDGLGGRTPVVATKDVTAAGWSGLKVKLSFTSDVVPHTAKAGTKVGSLTVGDGGAGAVKVPVALQRDLAEPGFTDKLTRLG